MSTTVEADEEATIASSKLVQIFDIPFSRLYRAKVTLPDGTVKNFPSLRSYAARLDINEDGLIEIEVKSKDKSIGNVVVKYPYYFIRDGVLCALKRFQHQDSTSFALNYDLFCLDWKTCILLHELDGHSFVYVTTRKEWEDNGTVGERNREVQMFLGASNFQRFEVDTLLLVMSSVYRQWLTHSIAECNRKKAK